MKKVDLHIHTDHSDGKWSVESVIQKAVEIDLSAISITDHDCMSGIPEAERLIARYPLELVPGVELSTKLLGKRIHLLAYYVSYKSARVRQVLDKLKFERLRRAKKIIDSLRELGLDITYQDIDKLKSESIGRPHIANYLIKKGVVRSKSDAFKKFLGEGCPACHEKFVYPPEQLIELVHNEGGVIGLAHPGTVHNDNIVREVVNMGLDSIEIIYPSHSKDDILKYKGLAKEYDLVCTGGSDFHGDDQKYAFLGSLNVDYEVVEQLKEAREKYLQ